MMMLIDHNKYARQHKACRHWVINTFFKNHFCFLQVRGGRRVWEKKSKNTTRVISVCLRENNVTEKSSSFFSRESRQLTYFLRALRRKKRGTQQRLLKSLSAATKLTLTFTRPCVCPHTLSTHCWPTYITATQTFVSMHVKGLYLTLPVNRVFILMSTSCCAGSCLAAVCGTVFSTSSADWIGIK